MRKTLLSLPLADEWRMSYKAESKNAPFFTSMASRSKDGFFSKSELWAGTAEGILKFDGEQWVNYHSITLQGNAKIRDAVNVYVGSERGLDEYVRQVKKFNDVKSAQDALEPDCKGHHYGRSLRKPHRKALGRHTQVPVPF